MSSEAFQEIIPECNSQNLEHFKLNTIWDDLTCPICLDFPHNGTLLKCSSYEKGCRPVLCNTDHRHSNCLNRLKTANEISGSPSTSMDKVNVTCPFCRGDVTGWIVVEEARRHLNAKKRSCQGENCDYVGNYFELDKHAKLEHPYAPPVEVDPTQQVNLENLQQSNEIIDVLSAVYSEIPRVRVDDYVIEHTEVDMEDEYEDFPGDNGNLWVSCILYQAFDNSTSSNQRLRFETRRHLRPRIEENDEEFVSRAGTARGSSSNRSSQRRRIGL